MGNYDRFPKLFRFLHQSSDRPLSQGEHVCGEDPHIKGTDHSQNQCDHRGGGKLEAGDFSLGFPEIHEHGDPQIIINRDCAVQDTEDGQPIKFRLHRCAEDIEFGHKSP